MSRTNPFWPLGLVAALAAALMACPPKQPEPVDSGPEEVPDAGEEDAGIDAGPFDAGYFCKKDDDCAVFNAGLRCEESTGACIPAYGCNDDTNCENQPVLPDGGDDYCYHYGLQCRCVPEPNDAGLTGICRRRRAVCEECTDPSQCGSGGTFDPAGTCTALPGDTSGKQYCLQARVGSVCGCGMVDNGHGYCKPQSNDCSQVGCTKDQNCPGGSVCNKNACLCEPRCRWDFSLKSEAPPGCPPGKVCWVDTANLDPGSLFYGAGRCRPPCNGNVDCTDTVANPFGGTNLKCAGEQLSGGGLSPKRCRANGECMDNLECPEQPNESIYLGYCDRAAFACKTDCRLGLDPVTAQSFRDCRSGYKCEASDAGTNVCVLRTCNEMGGARLACARGQYCCGEDKNFDGVADPCPPQNQRDTIGCYVAPAPPFCTTCTSQADCDNLALPSWLTGANACTNGSKSPSCSPLPTLCIGGGKRPDGSDGVNICAPSTWNSAGVTDGIPKAVRGCPATYAAVGFKPKIVDGDNYCQTNADCFDGVDAGWCDVDLTERLQDGGHPLACKCLTPGSDVGCPNSVDGGGMTSVCKDGIASPTVCLQSVVCVASSGVIYMDAGAPTFGCGL